MTKPDYAELPTTTSPAWRIAAVVLLLVGLGSLAKVALVCAWYVNELHTFKTYLTIGALFEMAGKATPSLLLAAVALIGAAFAWFKR